MSRIETYVFIDLETTGIPRQELNKTKIVELSMVAVKRRDILETTIGCLPRVVNKFTMCFNPGRLIDPGASKISGLDNLLLEYDTTFNMNVFRCINSFLECQQKPVCLVAENGYSFDFPILKNHFEKLNVSLADDIMCADSLYAFYDILKSPTNNSTSLVSPETQIDITKLDLIFGKKNNITVTNKDIIEEDPVESVINKDESSHDQTSNQQQLNETTPKKNTLKLKIQPKKVHEVRRKLFFEGDKKPKESYRLKYIYERVMGCPAKEAHRAENDCIMTAVIATAKAKYFVKWIDENYTSFSDVKAMTLGVPI